MVVKAKYRNSFPGFEGEIERSFMDRRNAVKWLLSFGLSKFDHHYIDGEGVTEELKASRTK